MTRVTQQQIADSLGLNRQTIARVLRGDPSVKSSTRKRVIGALNRCGYRYTSPFQSKTVIIDTSDDFAWLILRSVMETLLARGVKPVLLNHQKDPRRLYLEAGNADIIVFGNTPPPELIAKVRECNPDIFMINLFSSGIAGADVSINIDIAAGGRHSAEYLLKKGHRKIAVITSPKHLELMMRCQVFYATCVLRADPAEVRFYNIDLSKFPFADQILDFFDDLLADNTAVYTPGELIADVFYDIAFARKIEIPDRISLLSYNCIPAYKGRGYQYDAFCFKLEHLARVVMFVIFNKPLFEDALALAVNTPWHLVDHGTVKQLNA